jgi:hypothetical protein
MSMVSRRLAIHVMVLLLLLLLLIQIFFQILTTSSKSSYLTPFSTYLHAFSCPCYKIKLTIDFYNDEQLRIILEYLRKIKRRERQVYYKL